MNIRLDLQFDGTDLSGWQIQKDKPTVQGELKKALFAITGEEITPRGCGRTDAGVHARGYVCSFNSDTAISAEKLPYAVNANLPRDIVCTCASYAAPEFDAARSALGKRYRYTIDNSEFGNVFLSRYAWHYRFPLDIEAMRRAAVSFCGTHDFIGFAASGFSVKTTVRTINSLEIKKNGDIITADVTGNGFLYNMVRIIIGTLVYVGGGRISAADIPDIISSKCRSRAGITAPAKGLCLEEVFY